MRMQSTDRFLLAIVGGAVVLIIIAVVVVFTRAAPAYRAGNEPGDVVFNYILAVQRGDYERAYSYLSPALPGYPRSAADLREQLSRAQYYDSDTSYEVIKTEISSDRAIVTVRETIAYRGGLFSSSQSSNTFTMELTRTDAGWQLTSGSNWQFWMWCWEQKEGCS